MTLQEAIMNYMQADDTLKAYFTTPTQQIVYGDDITVTVQPRIVYRRISNPRLSNQPSRWQRWEFIITHVSKTTCEVIAEYLSAMWKHGKGVLSTFEWVESIVLDSGNTPIYDTTSKAFKIYLDVRFQYTGD